MNPPAPLHIAYLNQDFLPEVGAGPARIMEMSLRWQEQGARVTVVTGMPNRRIPGRGEGEVDPRYAGKLFVEEDWHGVRTLRSWVFTSNSLGFGAKMVNNASFMATGFASAIAKTGRPDVLIASSPPFLPHVSGVALSKLWRVPLVLEIRDLWPDYLVQMGVLKEGAAQRTLFALERWLLRRATHVVVVTESFKRRIIEKGVPADRITVIPNGVDTEYYRALPAGEVRPPVEALRRAEGEFLVGYIGTFGRGQALTQVVDAAAILAEAEPSIRIVLVGDGPDRDAINEAIGRHGLRNVSVSPPIPKAETPHFYNACDVCLVPLAPIPIFQETIPSKIFEVMACERPLIASLSGEGGRIVQESRAGLRVDAGDSRALAEAILELRRRPAAEHLEAGRRGRAYVTAHYSRRALADRYLSLLRSLAQQK